MLTPEDDPRVDGLAVSMRSVSKHYKGSASPALDDVSIDVEYGQVYGLLGPNGAGKTTSVGIMTTAVRPSSGRVRVCGLDVATHPSEVRGLIGIVPQENNLDRALSLHQNLIAHARYHGVGRKQREQRALALLEEFELERRAKERPHWLSGGQARRMMIARTMMHDPKVLFLDEPSNGLDPRVKRSVWAHVRRFADGGGAVVVTTHDMGEAETLCDRVAVINEGRLLANDSPQKLRDLSQGSMEHHATFAPLDNVPQGDLHAAALHRGLEARVLAHDGDLPGHTLIFESASALSDPGYVLSQLAKDCGYALIELRVKRATLEDVFMKFTDERMKVGE